MLWRCVLFARGNRNQWKAISNQWNKSRVRKPDVNIAWNSLKHNKIDTLNRLVVTILKYAKLRVKNRKALTPEYWQNLECLDLLRPFNDDNVQNQRMPQETSEASSDDELLDALGLSFSEDITTIQHVRTAVVRETERCPLFKSLSETHCQRGQFYHTCH